MALVTVVRKQPIKLSQGTVATIGILVGFPLLIFRQVRAWRRHLLIVGEDCIQVVERRSGEDHVIVQIPYANMAEFKREASDSRVGITLCRLDDADTYAPGENFQTNYRGQKRHYCLTFGYQHGARAIYSAMEKAYSRWASRAATERRPAKPAGSVPKRVPATDLLRAVREPHPERPFEVDLIRSCRERFGSPPRRLSASDAEACRLTLSPEVERSCRKHGDALITIVDEQHLLRDRGQVYWAHLLQANSNLFKPDNPDTLPAYIVYSTDSFFDGRVSFLASIAQGLFALKGFYPEDSELENVVRAITDEYERMLRRELPRKYCDGRSAYLATCFIQPGHLPVGYLARTAFPVIVNVAETEAVMILPARFWPAELVSFWQG